MTDPLVVDVFRGDIVESRHRIHAVLCRSTGQIVESWGEPDFPVIPRSAVKPIQALPLLETGAAAEFGLSDEEIAISCGSHGATPTQLRVIERWLKKLGLDETVLSCGPQRPMDEKAGDDILRCGRAFRPIHNNSSGQHVGFMTIARLLGCSVAGYADLDHPVQHLVTEALRDFTDHDPDARDLVRDGCGMPTMVFPLAALAMAAVNRSAGSMI